MTGKVEKMTRESIAAHNAHAIRPRGKRMHWPSLLPMRRVMARV